MSRMARLESPGSGRKGQISGSTEKLGLCGHGFLLGVKNAYGEQFQNREESLRRFGDNETNAIETYLQYLAQGCPGGDNKKAGQLSIIETTEIAGSRKGWPAVISSHEFVKNATTLIVTCYAKNR